MAISIEGWIAVMDVFASGNREWGYVSSWMKWKEKEYDVLIGGAWPSCSGFALFSDESAAGPCGWLDRLWSRAAIGLADGHWTRE